MSYRVLARAYRSHTFDEVVGQEAISTTLKNAITTDRVHHGYLFTGTRGVGKTSMARILAKALNCLAGDQPTPTPCGECGSCQAIAAGEDVDVVEIDAASNTGVNDIRDLRANAGFRPARSRYKVYIIDEVHMLSRGAFNALLKTLEEPPEHVKFILATTEPQKVLDTIKSRCQRFDFRAISPDRIATHLSGILDSEGIKADDYVLRRVARLANGSMRDALSLLDKLLSYESTHLTAEIADSVIPPPHDEQAAAVFNAIAASDPAAALAAFDEALQGGRTIELCCYHLVEHARTLMLIALCGANTDLVDVPDGARGELAQQAEQFDAPTFVYMIALLDELAHKARFGHSGRALADAAIVRLAMSRNFTDINDYLGTLGAAAGPDDASHHADPSKKKVTDDRPPAGGDGPRADRIEGRPASSDGRRTGDLSTDGEQGSGEAVDGPSGTGPGNTGPGNTGHIGAGQLKAGPIGANPESPADRPTANEVSPNRAVADRAATNRAATNRAAADRAAAKESETSRAAGDLPSGKTASRVAADVASNVSSDAAGDLSGESSGARAGDSPALDSSDGGAPQAPPRESGTVSPRPLTSEEWQRASSDPLVRRVRDAVDGTLFDILPAPPVSGDGDEGTDEMGDGDAEPSDDVES